MHSTDDIKSLYSFLNQTPEGPLRKMLVGGKDFTDAHFRVLLKLAKGGPENEFIDCFTAENFGKLRLSTKEAVLKEGFWPVIKTKCSSLGLLGPATKAA